MTEAIRLVIWDLDGTFWHGTVTEGGMVWREDAARAVKDLARRGIVSAICSKNTPAVIDDILVRHGMDGDFVFNSISWAPKGPRLAALVTAMLLRPESVLFIDDNPANLAEALHYVPGIQVADQTIVPLLLLDDRLRGKDDPGLSRLAQYKMLQLRHAAHALAREDGASDDLRFLRESGIVVRIEYDIEQHIDRAVELINRTNQLNFTKRRLPEAQDAARAELRALLSRHPIQAGLLHVRDAYGDHGFCGLYVLRSPRQGGRILLHFTFSCRILGMGVETWLYQRLGRPKLDVTGPVVSDVVGDFRDIDWIASEGAGSQTAAHTGGAAFTYVLARGGCDMRALSHYFGQVSGRVIEEFDTVRDGQAVLANHTLIAVQATRGLDAAAIRDAAPLGFAAEDFATFLAGDMPPGPAVWLLSFTIECGVPVFRHRATGALLPVFPKGMGVGGDLAALMRGAQIGTIDEKLATHLRRHFDFAGIVSDESFRESMRAIFCKAGGGVKVFVLLANARGVKMARVARAMGAQNTAIVEVAGEFGHVHVMDPGDFMSAAEMTALESPHHFGRMVYYRMFRHVMAVAGVPTDGLPVDIGFHWRRHGDGDGVTVESEEDGAGFFG